MKYDAKQAGMNRFTIEQSEIRTLAEQRTGAALRAVGLEKP